MLGELNLILEELIMSQWENKSDEQLIQDLADIKAEQERRKAAYDESLVVPIRDYSEDDLKVVQKWVNARLEKIQEGKYKAPKVEGLPHEHSTGRAGLEYLKDSIRILSDVS